MVGGVASGLAARTGFDVTVVRLVLVVVTVASGGLGAAGYVLAWLVVPAAARTATSRPRPGPTGGASRSPPASDQCSSCCC